MRFIFFCILIYLLVFSIIPWLILKVKDFRKELRERKIYRIKLQKLAPLINQMDVTRLKNKLEFLEKEFSRFEDELTLHKRINYKDELLSVNIDKYINKNKEFYEPKKNEAIQDKYMGRRPH